MLELKNVSRSYKIGQMVVALNDVSFKVSAGEFVAILGPSGCGKSTLLHVLGLLDAPDQGQYFIDGRSTEKMGTRERARLRNRTFGFVFQSFNLLPRTSAFDNVLLPLNYGSWPNRPQATQEALEKVGLGDRRDSRPNQLSGGQQQRVAIARAIVTNPKVILADEPTGNLDTKTGLEIMDLFKKIHQAGTTVIMVTHNEDLLRYANRVIRMRDGKIISDEKGKS